MRSKLKSLQGSVKKSNDDVEKIRKECAEFSADAALLPSLQQESYSLEKYHEEVRQGIAQGSQQVTVGFFYEEEYGPGNLLTVTQTARKGNSKFYCDSHWGKRGIRTIHQGIHYMYGGSKVGRT